MESYGNDSRHPLTCIDKHLSIFDSSGEFAPDDQRFNLAAIHLCHLSVVIDTHPMPLHFLPPLYLNNSSKTRTQFVKTRLIKHASVRKLSTEENAELS
jgi:hypothetical protein